MYKAYSYERQAHRANFQSKEALWPFATRIHACGPRAIYELLADLIRGRDLGKTLADFSRLDPATLAALTAIFEQGSRPQ